MNKVQGKIDINDFTTKVFDLWDNQWLLLTSGDFQAGKYNAMTVAWGGLGIMWNLPIAMVVVRPSRYTFQFINEYDTFTLCAFSEAYRKSLQLLGTKSGRDGNKIKEAGLTPKQNHVVNTPVFQEAELTIACRKIYYQDFIPSHFLDDRIERQYNGNDYHRMLYGEVLEIVRNPDGKGNN